MWLRVLTHFYLMNISLLNDLNYNFADMLSSFLWDLLARLSFKRSSIRTRYSRPSLSSSNSNTRLSKTGWIPLASIAAIISSIWSLEPIWIPRKVQIFSRASEILEFPASTPVKTPITVMIPSCLIACMLWDNVSVPPTSMTWSNPSPLSVNFLAVCPQCWSSL